jgi:hypothetical protein
LSIFLIETCDLQKSFFLGVNELLVAADMAVKLYYEEVPNEKLSSPSRLQALMDKAMDQVWKDHTSAFIKHLLICDLILGLSS